MKISCRGLLLIIVFFIPLFISAQEIYWWSNIPPASKQQKIVPYGMHKISSIRGKKGKSQIIQWLRNGDNITSSAFLSQQPEDSEIILFDPDGMETETSVNRRDKDFSILYSGEIEGFYNLFLLHQFVRNDTLFVLIAKAERLSHSCRNGHKEERKYVPYRTYPDKIPFEIIRERFRQEDYHFFLNSGDDVTFQVLLNGQVVDHALIQLTTEKGWSVRKYTDDLGKISIEMIGDFYSRWKEFQKDKIHNFLAIATYCMESAGENNGNQYSYVHYTSTYTDSYKASVYQYSSFVYGFFAILLIVLISVIVIIIFRSRKKDHFLWRGTNG